MSATDFAAVPLALRERAQWLCWRLEEKPGAKKPAKMPYYASGKRRTGVQGSDEDRAHLVTFDVACQALEAKQFSGIGFAFLPDDGLIGIDLDKMVDADSGELSPRAQRIIEACESYTEWSPSGNGFHIYVFGTTETAKDNGIGVEMFCGRQFFTVTGRHLAGSPAEVAPIAPAVLRRLHKTIAEAKGGFSDKPDEAPTAPAPAVPPAPTSGQTSATRPAAPPSDIEKLRSALDALDPGCGYDEWIRIGMALRSELGEGGFELWDAWSLRSERYPGSPVLQSHWKSFTRDSVKAGTIYRLAKQAGWKPPRAPARRTRSSQGVADDSAANSATDSATESASTPSEAGAGKEKKRDFDHPFIPDLVFDGKEIKCCLSNVYQIFAHDARWKGVVAYDEFALCTVKRKPPPYSHAVVGEWEATDDTRAAMWLTINYGFTPSSTLVAEAIETWGRTNAFHPVRDWLAGLKWDGTKRLHMWLADYLGVKATDYSMRVAKWWLMAAVARALRPGCKFDYCLVLCGPQGKGKSQAFSILGGEWFGDTDIDLGHKDGMSALRGKLIYEIAELGALARSEERRQKSFLSRQVDEYRPVYGRREIKAPRQMVFGGTTNEHEWQKDPTGGRRFWPAECDGEFNLQGLRDNREQLFAEALVCVEASGRFWPTAEEQRTLFDPEQLKVEQQESLIDALHDWAFNQVADFSLAQAAMDGLKLDASKLTRDLQTRIGNALRKLGCAKVEKRNGITRFWYQPPVQEGEATSKHRGANLAGKGAVEHDDHDYF